MVILLISIAKIPTFLHYFLKNNTYIPQGLQNLLLRVIMLKHFLIKLRYDLII